MGLYPLVALTASVPADGRLRENAQRVLEPRD
jgi:hypothetical protein